MSGKHQITAPTTYLEQLRAELRTIETDYQSVLAVSAVQNIDPNRHAARSGIAYVGYAIWGWAPSDDDLERARLALLPIVRSWSVRFRLLFPDPTSAVRDRLDQNLDLLERWLERKPKDKTVPRSVDLAREQVRAAVADLDALLDLIPADQHPVRLVVDTNTVIDDPDLARYTSELGPAYLVHVLPVVLHEIDELKRAGRTEDLRNNARRADRRLKSLRDNGDVRTGATVSGQVKAIFDFREPAVDGLPSWLDLTVPDDRLVAACLRLQSDHPGSALFVATGDLNLQNKLAAVGLPFVELP